MFKTLSLRDSVIGEKIADCINRRIFDENHGKITDLIDFRSNMNKIEYLLTKTYTDFVF